MPPTPTAWSTTEVGLASSRPNRVFRRLGVRRDDEYAMHLRLGLLARVVRLPGSHGCRLRLRGPPTRMPRASVSRTERVASASPHLQGSGETRPPVAPNHPPLEDAGHADDVGAPGRATGAGGGASGAALLVASEAQERPHRPATHPRRETPRGSRTRHARGNLTPRHAAFTGPRLSFPFAAPNFKIRETCRSGQEHDEAP